MIDVSSVGGSAVKLGHWSVATSEPRHVTGSEAVRESVVDPIRKLHRRLDWIGGPQESACCQYVDDLQSLKATERGEDD